MRGRCAGSYNGMSSEAGLRESGAISGENARPHRTADARSPLAGTPRRARCETTRWWSETQWAAGDAENSRASATTCSPPWSPRSVAVPGWPCSSRILSRSDAWTRTTCTTPSFIARRSPFEATTFSFLRLALVDSSGVPDEALGPIAFEGYSQHRPRPPRPRLRASARRSGFAQVGPRNKHPVAALSSSMERGSSSTNSSPATWCARRAGGVLGAG